MDFGMLDSAIARQWERIRQNRLSEHVMVHGCTLDLYTELMAQIYHYTQYNPINQAAATWATDPQATELIRFCCEHALDELTHDRMIVRDLESIGVDASVSLLRPPAPSTCALISYLGDVALRHGAIARLGYSYWAEDAYGDLAPLITKVASDLGLTERNMTFFTAHQKIDERHSLQVRRLLEQYVQTDAAAREVCLVAETTLRLTGSLMEDCLDAVLERSNA